MGTKIGFDFQKITATERDTVFCVLYYSATVWFSEQYLFFNKWLAESKFFRKKISKCQKKSVYYEGLEYMVLRF